VGIGFSGSNRFAIKMGIRRKGKIFNRNLAETEFREKLG
jgi:hypothetical protein